MKDTCCIAIRYVEIGI